LRGVLRKQARGDEQYQQRPSGLLAVTSHG